MAEECPAKFLWRSPWNPLYEPEAKTEFDIGVAAHLAVLEPERQARKIVPIEAGDYRTTKAREAREAARAEGKVPLLPYQLDIVRAITGSIRARRAVRPRCDRLATCLIEEVILKPTSGITGAACGINSNEPMSSSQNRSSPSCAASR